MPQRDRPARALDVAADAEHANDELAEREDEHKDRHAGGPAPGVQAGFADPGRTASELAFEDDENVRELKVKVAALVAKNFAGDYHKAFEHYDGNHDGGVERGELRDMLADAGVGNGLTRGAWARRIIETLDRSGDAAIQWSEFESVFRVTA